MDNQDHPPLYLSDEITQSPNQSPQTPPVNGPTGGNVFNGIGSQRPLAPSPVNSEEDETSDAGSLRQPSSQGEASPVPAGPSWVYFAEVVLWLWLTTMLALSPITRTLLPLVPVILHLVMHPHLITCYEIPENARNEVRNVLRYTEGGTLSNEIDRERYREEHRRAERMVRRGYRETIRRRRELEGSTLPRSRRPGIPPQQGRRDDDEDEDGPAAGVFHNCTFNFNTFNLGTIRSSQTRS
ncbi:hypothetical protein PHISCL_09759 [Aspergillus sclerotialis]|uniref:Uncharacterized protein n=1 Tax=Aspergillus sclerotialis TaxID=2070753 RepID=A0A3A2ZF04_9EURO|nr:hypothetical protein PHISCL_09759 [Aspergillus sclerotialis]